jgi:L-aminopeptidase/D-esterase-like protein
MNTNALSLDDLTNALLIGAESQLGDALKSMAGFAKEQMKLISLTIIGLESLQKSGQITPEQAKADLAIAKNSVQMALITELGLTKLAAQRVVDDALDAVADLIADVVDITL